METLPGVVPATAGTPAAVVIGAGDSVGSGDVGAVPMDVSPAAGVDPAVADGAAPTTPGSSAPPASQAAP